MKNSLNIKVLATSSGIQAHTIRTWEKRYNVFDPERDANGRRRYSEDDLIKLKLLAKLTTNEGFSISQLANHNTKELQDIYDGLNKDNRQHENRLETAAIENLLDYLNSYDFEKIVAELEYLKNYMGSKSFIFKVVLPVLRRIGDLQAEGVYTVTQEHIVSTIIREQLSRIEKSNVETNLPKFALATPDGNQHELPILIGEILCRSNRVPTFFLGAGHPADSLAQALSALSCNKLILGVTTSDKWNFDRDLIPFLRRLDRELDQKINIYLGGAMEMELPKFNNFRNVFFVPTFEELDDLLLNKI